MIEVHRLTIRPRAFCSEHHHQFKWNAFLVLEGKLFISVKKQSYDLTDTTELGPGELCTVKPGEIHQFRTGEQGCKAIEIYYPEILSEDIVRLNVGGIKEAKRARNSRSRK